MKMGVKSVISTLLLALIVLPVLSPLAVAEAPQKGGTLVVALVAEPRVIDPTTGAWNAGFVAAQIFNSLLELDENLNIVPSLAESWEIDEKEGAFIFKLREGVKWHDGHPFTAEDVKFSFENIISKYDVFGALYFKDTKVEIIDERTVKIKPGDFLPGVQLYLMATLDTAILPKHILEGQDFLKSEFRTKPIGTGPFKFVEWLKGSHITLVRNENYWKEGKPYLDKIVIRFISDPATLIAELEAGNVNYVFRGVPYEAYDRLKGNPNLDVILSERPPYKVVLEFNTKHPILSDVRVRKAIAYAIDKEEIARKATNGLALPTHSFWAPEDVPPSPNIVRYEYNPEMAEKLLDEAGYPRGRDGKRFTLELLTRVGEPEEAIVAELIRDYLSRVGIEVNIKAVDFATMLDLQSNYKYDFTLVKRWVAPIWGYQLFHSEWIRPGQPFTNIMQYSNPEVDQLFDLWFKEIDPEKQKRYLQRIDEILTDELPEIPLYTVVFLNVKSANVKGPDIPVGKYVFWDPLENTYIETAAPTAPTVTPAEEVKGPSTALIAGIVVAAVALAAVAALLLRKR
uniref:Solute-binding protein family 5 domain-containing protein n=1 Tax=Fervidicoccus fontis TaxID=683846 RepID=A0A7J3ZJZ6_9CREN